VQRARSVHGHAGVDLELALRACDQLGAVLLDEV
jgi:hypothetical protein